MNKKILIIGQAPAAVKQGVPYDTTMLYTWLEECGINKEQAQEMFEFEAMTDKFPGHGNSGHKVPTDAEMCRHYSNVLSKKLNQYSKCILLGNVAKKFMGDYNVDFQHPHMEWLSLIHPSKRNYDRYMQNKETIINSLRGFINK